MAKHYSIEKEARFGLDIVIMGPGVCEVLAPETYPTIEHLEFLKMLDAAFEAGMAANERKAKRVIAGMIAAVGNPDKPLVTLLDRDATRGRLKEVARKAGYEQ